MIEMTKLNKILFILLLLLSFTSCKKEKQSNWTLQVTKLKFGYAQTAKLTLSNAISSYTTFDQKVSLFNSVMADWALNNCRTEWQNAYNNYLLLGGFQYCDEYCTANFNSNQKYIDFSPINYSFVDYTAIDPNSGIINNSGAYPTLGTGELLNLHQQGDDKNATVGFHVMEFLFWGEDQSLTTTNTRSANEFLSTSTVTARRKSFLISSTNATKQKINALSFGTTFENELNALSPKSTLDLIIGGLTKYISEDIINHTIQQPLNSQSHLDEISDFSDLTLTHLIQKIKGVKIIWDGRNLFNDPDNTNYFLVDFAGEVAPESRDKINSSLKTIDNLLNSISMNFENAIVSYNERAKLTQVINELTIVISELNSIKQMVD